MQLITVGNFRCQSNKVWLNIVVTSGARSRVFMILNGVYLAWDPIGLEKVEEEAPVVVGSPGTKVEGEAVKQPSLLGTLVLGNNRK